MDFQHGRIVLEAPSEAAEIIAITGNSRHLFEGPRAEELGAAAVDSPVTLSLAETLRVISAATVRLEIADEQDATEDEKSAGIRSGLLLSKIALFGVFDDIADETDKAISAELSSREQSSAKQPPAERTPERGALDYMSIGELGLGNRAYFLLRRNGIENVGQLSNLSRFELKEIPQLGDKLADEICGQALAVGVFIPDK